MTKGRVPREDKSLDKILRKEFLQKLELKVTIERRMMNGNTTTIWWKVKILLQKRIKVLERKGMMSPLQLRVNLVNPALVTSASI